LRASTRIGGIPEPTHSHGYGLGWLGHGYDVHGYG